MQKKRLFYLGLAALVAWGSIAAWTNYLSMPQRRELAAAKLGLPPIAGDWYYADMKSGNETSDGYLPTTAVCSLKTAYKKCVSGRGDGVALLPDSTSYTFTVATTCTLNRMNSTIFGVTANGNPYFNRVRVTGSATTKAASISPLFLLTAQGISLINIHANNEDSLGYRAVKIAPTSCRNYFENCHFIGASKASEAADSLTACAVCCSSSSENLFKHCWLGTNSTPYDGIKGDMGVISLTGAQGQNYFEDCYVLLQSTDNNDCFPILRGADGTTIGYTVFKNCAFIAHYPAETPATQQAVVGGAAQASPGLLFMNCAYVGCAELDEADDDNCYINGNNATFLDSCAHASPTPR